MLKTTFWERRKFFDSYGSRPNEQLKCNKGNVPETCPCCGYPTIGQGFGNICELCDWEDEGQDDYNADEVIGIPNGQYSLVEARFNFEHYLQKRCPDDEFYRPDSDRRIEIKLKLIAAFDALMDGPSSEESARLWQMVEDCKQALYQELKREIFGELFAPAPCPYCGESLRTVNARQCRKCGMDWHDPNNITRLKVRP